MDNQALDNKNNQLAALFKLIDEEIMLDFEEISIWKSSAYYRNTKFAKENIKYAEDDIKFMSELKKKLNIH